jgi:DNA-binding response OmpR family regulator
MAEELILVADDEQHTVELVSLYLRRAGYRTEAAANGDEALRKARELKPALLVLDVMMPGPDGLQVCRALRHRGEMSVVLLTARTSDFDKVAGLRLGADDYVTKPFNPDELVARVEAVLRRAADGTAGHAGPGCIRLGPMDMDMSGRSASIEGHPLSLRPREFDLLATFARFPGNALGRDQLLDLVWGTSFYASRTVDVHVARLREKLSGSPFRIDTVWGTGYRLVLEE